MPKNTNGKLPAYFKEYLDERFSKVNDDMAELRVQVMEIKKNCEGFGNCASDLKTEFNSFVWRIKIISYLLGGVALLFLVHIGINDGVVKYVLTILGL